MQKFDIETFGIEEGGRILIERKKGPFSSIELLNLIIDEGYEEIIIGNIVLKLNYKTQIAYLYNITSKVCSEYSLAGFFAAYIGQGSSSGRKRLDNMTELDFPKIFDNLPLSINRRLMEKKRYKEVVGWGTWTFDTLELDRILKES